MYYFTKKDCSVYCRTKAFLENFVPKLIFRIGVVVLINNTTNVKQEKHGFNSKLIEKHKVSFFLLKMFTVISRLYVAVTSCKKYIML